jgi:hypothetical protein
VDDAIIFLGLHPVNGIAQCAPQWRRLFAVDRKCNPLIAERSRRGKI